MNIKFLKKNGIEQNLKFLIFSYEILKKDNQNEYIQLKIKRIP